MKSRYQMAALAIVLGGFAATAQTTIFNENFDGGYTGCVRHRFVFGRQPHRYRQCCAGEWRKSERLLAGDHDDNNRE